MKSESFVSVVIVIPDHLNYIYASLSKLASLLDTLYSDYELVVIAPGLDSTSAQVEDRVLKDIPCVRIIQLSTPVFHDVALAAG